MHRIFPVVLCCLLVASCGGSDAPPPDDATVEPQAVSFPLEVLEVLGAPGTEVTLTVKIEAAVLSGGDNAAVTLTLHNIVQEDSAQFVINGGAPIDLSS